MKSAAILMSFIGLLLGAYYGFASSPNYTRILNYSIVLEIMALSGCLLWFSTIKGGCRILPVLCAVLAIIIIVQAVIRLAK